MEKCPSQKNCFNTMRCFHIMRGHKPENGTVCIYTCILYQKLTMCLVYIEHYNHPEFPIFQNKIKMG